MTDDNKIQANSIGDNTIQANLTKQWKAGELPEGWYYIKVNDELANHPVITECVSDYNLSGKPIPDFYEYDDDKIIEVLAPVPSYEQWIMTKNLSERAHLEMYKARGEKVRFEKENTKLKELLKECSYRIDWTDKTGHKPTDDERQKLFDEISQVLGEE